MVAGFGRRMRSRWRLNVSSRSPPRDLWSEVTGGVYCAASVTLLWLCTEPSSHSPGSTLALSPSSLLTVSLSLSLPLFLTLRLPFRRRLSFSFRRSLVRSFSKLSQVHASPPSYIQQTPSIYSFELDGSKGKVAGCRCVNFSNAELSTSRLFRPHPPTLPFLIFPAAAVGLARSPRACDFRAFDPPHEFARQSKKLIVFA